MEGWKINLVSLIVSAIVTGLSAFFGVRIALARVEERLKAIAEQLAHQDTRISRLEEPFFKRAN